MCAQNVETLLGACGFQCPISRRRTYGNSTIDKPPSDAMLTSVNNEREKMTFRFFILALCALFFATASSAGSWDQTVSKPCPEAQSGMLIAANQHARNSCAPFKVKDSSFSVFPGTMSCRVFGTFNCSTDRASTASTPTPPVTMVQQCEVKELKTMGYSSGNRHEYCLKSGYNGGHISGKGYGSCWKSTTGPTTHATDCPRLNSYYNSVSNHTCAHLTDEDARTLKVCSHNR